MEHTRQLVRLANFMLYLVLLVPLPATSSSSGGIGGANTNTNTIGGGSLGVGKPFTEISTPIGGGTIASSTRDKANSRGKFESLAGYHTRALMYGILLPSVAYDGEGICLSPADKSCPSPNETENDDALLT
ncbi:hypothetical protein ZHAS_00021777 [Anopheles sinensis]|uniref:Uncharacterized protein n=1 Tax=Anopheles sinensis TaxID=74873 RepID=A0A084WTK2_ANOSI|nr:hypothetical protein ZHAS_00021777 [Anopheles sinensis]